MINAFPEPDRGPATCDLTGPANACEVSGLVEAKETSKHPVGSGKRIYARFLHLSISGRMTDAHLPITPTISFFR